MKTNNRRLVAIAVVLVLVGAVVLSVAIGEGRKTYRVEPEITVPEYKDDTARAIDAYERLMERYMDITEKNMLKSGDIQTLLGKLDAVNGKLDELSARMARIEKALGITPSPVVQKDVQIKSTEESSPAKLPATGAGRDSAGGTFKKEIPAQGERSIRR
jgi:hypothetical protein